MKGSLHTEFLALKTPFSVLFYEHDLWTLRVCPFSSLATYCRQMNWDWWTLTEPTLLLSVLSPQQLIGACVQPPVLLMPPCFIKVEWITQPGADGLTNIKWLNIANKQTGKWFHWKMNLKKCVWGVHENMLISVCYDELSVTKWMEMPWIPQPLQRFAPKELLYIWANW